MENSAAADVPEATAPVSRGFVELLNDRREPLGARQRCEFVMEVSPSQAAVELLTDHDFAFSAAEGAVTYIALRADDGALLCMLRLPDSATGTGIFGVGPHRSGLLRYRRILP